MSEGTYEYECMRAELLGIEKPDYDAFVKRKLEEEAKQTEEEQADVEMLKEADVQGEQMKNVSGGLEELNSILSMTQKKIDRFKVRCNSITSLLKIKVGSITSGDVPSGSCQPNQPEVESDRPEEDDVIEARNGNEKKSDISRTLDGHVDKLDAMLESADNAYNRLSHQNKQMKKYLN